MTYYTPITTICIYWVWQFRKWHIVSPTLFKSGLYYKSNQRSINATNTNCKQHDRGWNFWSKNLIFLPHTRSGICIWHWICKNRKMVECDHITSYKQMDWWWDNQRSGTNLPRQLGLGGYNMSISNSFFILILVLTCFIIVALWKTPNHTEAQKS